MDETRVRLRGGSRHRRPAATVMRDARRDLVTALRLGPVRGGLLGSILLAAGSFTPAYLPQASPYWEPARALGLDSWWAKAAGTGLVIVAVGLLMVAWFNLRPSIYLHVKHWAVLVWWSLPLLLAPPIFSHDAYSYAAQGWLIHNDLNPYTSSPSYLPGPFADQVAWVWRYTAAPYGPLSLQLSHAIVDLAGLNPYYSAVAHRVPALLGVALIAYFLPRLAGHLDVDPRQVAWFSVINPLILIDFVGGCHNDALMMGCVVAALTLAYRGWWVAALVLVGVGAAIKQPAILATFPIAVIGSSWASWQVRHLARFAARLAVAAAISVGTFAAISWATGLGFGWLNAVTVPGMIVTMAPFSLLGFGAQYVANLLTGDPEGRLIWTIAQSAGVAASFVIVAFLAITRGRRTPVTFLTWAYLTFAILGPALHPWYLTWGGLLLPLTKPSPRTWRLAASLVAILLVYGAGNLAWRNELVGLALAAVAASIIVIYRRYQAGHWPLTGVGDEGRADR